jgi:rubrerythrin
LIEKNNFARINFTLKKERNNYEVERNKNRKNLLASFAGESQARNRYTYFASIAKKEGYEQIAAFFLETADNEKEHPKYSLNYWKEEC